MGPLVLIALVVAIVFVVRAARQGSQPPPGIGTRSNVADDLARWVAAGLLSQEQSAAILAHEAAHAVPAVAVEAPGAARRIEGVPVVAEALGYLGGMLGVAGLIMVAGNYWADMATGLRLALSGGGAVGLWAAGAIVRERAAPALARLRGFLWLLSTAAAALFGAVLVVDGFGREGPATIALACASAVVVESALLWWWRDRPIQELTLLGGLVVSAGAVAAEFGDGGATAMTVWVVGVCFVALGLRRLVPQPVLTEAVGAISTVVGGGIAAGNWRGFGSLFLLATGLGLVALAIIPGPAPDKEDQSVLGFIGALTLLEAVPGALAFFGRDAGGATGIITWASGAALAWVGARRLVRVPAVTEVVGGAAIIGGAALTGIQWHGFAPLFGAGTAVALIALGMLPGQVLLSVFGSLGLLVNVPWAIGWFFPGRGRVPLLIFVAGALIVAIAALLGRGGGRFRRDLGGPRHRTPPPRLTPGTS